VPLVIDKKGSGQARPGDLAVVRPGRGRARLERVLGSAKAIENVLEGLLVEAGERGGFEPFDARERSLEGRVDLRDELTFTIDPETAKDFDDALTLHDDRVFVHIADVSWFVQAGTPLDRGAARRAFSVYVPGLVSPMLPPELSDDLCSLRPSVDRLCVTVEVELGSGEPRFYRSVIRSDARLTYAQAEAILAGRERVEPELLEALRRAERVTTELRERRFARGALRIEGGDLAFEFDGEGGVANAWRESEPHAHTLVEELMILANEAVAGLLAGRRREALYRVHERPEPQAVELLLSKLADLGVPTPPSPDPMTPLDAAAVAAAASEGVTRYAGQSGRGRSAFPALVLRSLKQARYDPANLGHSGLASPAYCHFTSPIRRYPDLVCHRALLAVLGEGEETPSRDLVREAALHCSERERESARIERDADDVCAAFLLERELYEGGWERRFEGEVRGLIGAGAFVAFGGELGDVYEGFLPARRIRGERFELNETETALVGTRTERAVRLGDPLTVTVEMVEAPRGRVDLEPADG
jgi:ribonuclease R